MRERAWLPDARGLEPLDVEDRVDDVEEVREDFFGAGDFVVVRVEVLRDRVGEDVRVAMVGA